MQSLEAEIKATKDAELIIDMALPTAFYLLSSFCRLVLAMKRLMKGGEVGYVKGVV